MEGTFSLAMTFIVLFIAILFVLAFPFFEKKEGKEEEKDDILDNFK